MDSNRPTLEELMHSQNSSRWPARWSEVYDEVMDDFENNGCVLLDPSYYDEISDRYGILKDFKEDYKLAAREISKDSGLSRVLALICDTMKHRSTAMEESDALELPHNADGSYDIKYEMITALAMTYMVDYTYGHLKARNLPEHHIDYAMNVFDGMIKTYKVRNGDRVGAMSWSWYQLGVDARLFELGSLQMEMQASFPSYATVFENNAGKTVALANNAKFHREGHVFGAANYTDEEGAWEATIEESNEAYVGYAFDDYGKLKRERTVLSKSEWHVLINAGDPMISVHIPPAAKLSDEAIEEAFALTKEFADLYYPEFDYKGFICSSWLMDRHLVDMLGEKSNISRFCKRFNRISKKSPARSVFSFVFLRSDVDNVDYASLPENTSLERALKKHYLDGGAVHEYYGYIPRGKI